MLAYVIRRVVLMAPTLLGLSVFIFALMRLLPGDTVLALMAESGTFNEAQIAALRQQWHLDESYLQQYARFLGDLVRGDLGTSLYYNTSVASEIGRRLPITLQLSVYAIVLSTVAAIPLGVIAGARAGGWLDAGVRLMTVLGQAVPNFWLGTMVVVGLAFYLRWLPPKGYVSPFDDPFVNAQQMIFPALVLAWSSSAVVTRLMRNSLLEVLRQDYVRTAQAKGLGAYTVVVRHAMRNALLPVVTMLGVQFAFLLGGSVIVESIFTVPGMGSLALKSIEVRDYSLLQGVVMVFGVLVLVVNLAIDLSYLILDPRIRYS
jgi:peptide/nickel transport system permease protein